MKKSSFCLLVLLLLCMVVTTAWAETIVYQKPQGLFTPEELEKVDDTDCTGTISNGYFSLSYDHWAENAYEVKTGTLYDYIELIDGTVSIIRMKSYSSDIVIPDTIDGKVVSELGAGMGFDFDGFTGYDFSSANVKTITFPQGLTGIGSGSIQATSMKTLTLPEGLKNLYGWTVFYMKSGSIMEMSKEMTYIGPMIQPLGAKKVILPERVETMMPYVFTHAPFIQEAVLPAYVGSLGVEIFSHAQALKKLTFREGLTTISDRMCLDCAKLSALAFPQSLTTIGQESFAQCKKLQKVTFKDNSLKQIGVRAFSECASLKKVVLPNGLEEIGEQAFYGCSKLSSVTIPASVTSIGENAFLACAKKITFTVTAGSYAEAWATENGYKVKTVKAK